MPEWGPTISSEVACVEYLSLVEQTQNYVVGVIDVGMIAEYSQIWISHTVPHLFDLVEPVPSFDDEEKDRPHGHGGNRCRDDDEGDDDDDEEGYCGGGWWWWAWKVSQSSCCEDQL